MWYNLPRYTFPLLLTKITSFINRTLCINYIPFILVYIHVYIHVVENSYGQKGNVSVALRTFYKYYLSHIHKYYLSHIHLCRIIFGMVPNIAVFGNISSIQTLTCRNIAVFGNIFDISIIGNIQRISIFGNKLNISVFGKVLY